MGDEVCVLRIRPSLLFFHTIEDFVDIHGFVDFHVGSGAQLSDGQPKGKRKSIIKLIQRPSGCTP